MCLLRSVQTSQIKHAGTIFHMVDRCFPNQFLQAKRRELTVIGITQWIPNTSKIALHKAWENLQWRRRWSTVSPSQQHLLTKVWPRLTRLTLGSFNLWISFISFYKEYKYQVQLAKTLRKTRSKIEVILKYDLVWIWDLIGTLYSLL